MELCHRVSLNEVV